MATDRMTLETLGRAGDSAQRVFEYARTHPILSIAATATATGLSFPATAAVVANMQHLGILREITGRQRSRMFAYQRYLDILNEGTEPL